MNLMIIAFICAMFPVILSAGSLTIEGSYTCQWNSKSPKTFKGTLEAKSDDFEGDVLAPWNSKDEVYRGRISKSGGNYEGEFVLLSQKRTFKFSVPAGGGTCDAFEKGSKVGTLSMKISGSSEGTTAGPDFAGLVAFAVNKKTGISGEKVLELFAKKRGSKEDIIAACAVSEITGDTPEELCKKKKKYNTNYEFLRELKLDKEKTAKVNELIKIIKEEIEKEKKNK